MATFIANVPLNMEFEVFVGETQPLSNRKATSFQVNWGDGFKTVYSGTNLLANAGVIKSAEDFQGSTSRWEISDISVTVSKFQNLMGSLNGNGIYITDYLSGDDTVTGSTGDDTLVGYAGDDVIEGGLGDDTLDGDGNEGTEGTGDIASYENAAGAVNVSLETGVATGAAGADDLFNFEGIIGSDFGDVLAGDLHDNIIFGGGGIDDIEGQQGNDDIDGGGGNDTIDGGDNNDKLAGGAGDDDLTGGLGIDTLNGGDGLDTLNGGANADKMNGGNGADTYYVDNAGDAITEENVKTTAAERDTVNSSIASYTLTANVENLILTGSAVTGIGNAGNNAITGNALANTLTGGGGNDAIDGGAGDDTINGGAGKDTLTGGADEDTFVFSNIKDLGANAATRDVVNFVSADDTIVLTGVDANANKKGDQNFVWTNAGDLDAAFTKVAGQLRFADGVIYGDTDGNGKADFQIEIIGTLVVGDVIL